MPPGIPPIVPCVSDNALLLIVPIGVQVPPIVYYVFGAILVVYGILRAKYFGAPRTRRGSDEKADASKETSPVRGPNQRRSRRLGILSVLFGLLILLSTCIENC